MSKTAYIYKHKTKYSFVGDCPVQTPMAPSGPPKWMCQNCSRDNHGASLSLARLSCPPRNAIDCHPRFYYITLHFFLACNKLRSMDIILAAFFIASDRSRPVQPVLYHSFICLSVLFLIFNDGLKSSERLDFCWSLQLDSVRVAMLVYLNFWLQNNRCIILVKSMIFSIFFSG